MIAYKCSCRLNMIFILIGLLNGCQTSGLSNRSLDTQTLNEKSSSEKNILEQGTPRIRIRWTTETEENAFGYLVYRANSENEELLCINPEQPLPAAGTTVIPHQYTFYDLKVDFDKTYYYQVYCLNLDGSEDRVFQEERIPAQARKLSLEDIETIQKKGILFREEKKEN